MQITKNKNIRKKQDMFIFFLLKVLKETENICSNDYEEEKQSC